MNTLTRQRVCIICSAELTGKQLNACSTVCANKVYTNRRRESGKLKGPKPRKYPFTCIVCDRAGMATKPDTKRHSYCQRFTASNPGKKLSSSTELIHVPKDAPQLTVPETKGSFWWAGNCKVCDKNFIAKHGYTTCSDACNSIHQRDKRASTKHRYRARKRNAATEKVSRIYVYERDNYMCMICGEATQPHAAPQDNKYPSLDHIIALANGGSHSYKNLQTAHRICNSIKRDL